MILVSVLHARVPKSSRALHWFDKEHKRTVRATPQRFYSRKCITAPNNCPTSINLVVCTSINCSFTFALMEYKRCYSPAIGINRIEAAARRRNGVSAQAPAAFKLLSISAVGRGFPLDSLSDREKTAGRLVVP